VIEFDYVPAHFRFVHDGEERILPALEGEKLGRWHARYAGDKMAGLDAMMEAAEAGNLPSLLEAHSMTMDAMVDALVAYDATGALGGKEWLEEHLDPRQLLLILHRIQVAHA